MRRWPGLVLLLALAFPALAADDGWRLDKEKDGIQVYSRKVEGWSIREIRGVTRVPARLSTVVAIVNDPKALRELNPMVAEAEVQQRESATRYRIHTVTDMPWPLSDRELLIQREISQDAKSRAVLFKDNAVADDQPARKGLVRMTKSQQSWTFTPVAGGGIEVDLRLLADPNGPIPSGIINAMSVDVPYDMMQRLRGVAARSDYANATLPFVEEP